MPDELEKRKRLRQKKVREEKRREKRIEMEENKKQGKCKYSRWRGHGHRSERCQTDMWDPTPPQILRCILDWRIFSISQPSGLLLTTAAPRFSWISLMPPLHL